MALCDLSGVSRTDASWRDPCALPQNFRYVAVMTRGSGLVRIWTMRPVRECREENIRATRPHGLYLDAVVGTVSNSSRMPDSVLRKSSEQLLSLHQNLRDCPLHLFHNGCSEGPLTQCFPLSIPSSAQTARVGLDGPLHPSLQNLRRSSKVALSLR